jgi:gluconate 2-dehydrogenase gamma chain
MVHAMASTGKSGRISRRKFVGGGAAALGGGLVAGAIAVGGHDHSDVGEHDHSHHSHAQEPQPRLRVLNPAEAALAGAMADRVFPPDGNSPGATDIGVVQYLDGQLAGDWGAGARFYRQGPFPEPDESGFGYQLPLTPRELYKHALPLIDEHARRHYGDVMAALAPEQQDKVMSAIEGGEVDLELAQGPNGFQSGDFFVLFIQNVKEGLFADPIYGGNRNVAGWKWIGFPGDPMAYDDSYFYLFSNWRTPYDVEPQGLDATMAQNGH